MTTDSGFEERCSLTDKMWTCNLCLGYYCKPKLLPCTHSYCFDCIDSLVDIWSPEQKESCNAPGDGNSSPQIEESPKTSSNDVAFWCPECHKEVTLPSEGIDGFPDNVYVRDHSTVMCLRKRPVMCQICKKESAVFLCKDCKQIYCSFCHDYHKRFSNTKSHVVKNLEHILSHWKNRMSSDYMQMDSLFISSTGKIERDIDRTVDHPITSNATDVTSGGENNGSASSNQAPQPEYREPHDRGKSRSLSRPKCLVRTDLLTEKLRDSDSNNPVPPLPPRPSSDPEATNQPERTGNVTLTERTGNVTLTERTGNVTLTEKPPIFHFKCGRRTVHTFCMDSTGRVVMCSRVNKPLSKKIRLTAFNCNGKKFQNKPTDSLSVSMASLVNEIVMIADREKSTLSWTTASTLQLNKYCDISITGPVLSKPVPGRSAYVIGKGPADVYEIARVVFPGELKSVMSLKNIPAMPCSFDVSSDEQYFAVVSVQNGLRVSVFNKGQENPVSTYELKQSSADICFHTSETYDREVLLLAVGEINQTIMLDHLDHCKVLGIMRNNRPNRLSKDTAGRTLVACNWENPSEAEVMSLQI